MSNYVPPFHMTDQITNLVSGISEEIGRITVLSHGSLNPHLRKENRIKTIHSSLAIEHNSLSLEQVTAILNGKRILGNPNEIREVQNAYETYEMMLSLNPLSIEDLLKAHRLMMQGLIPENGRFRSGGVGVFDGQRLIHMAPPAVLVPGQIEDLLSWYASSSMHPLIKSAVFHYEFEFIHPFADGNGRMGRMWHSLLLGQWKDLFYWLPIEELIRTRQDAYYQALREADLHGESHAFAEFMLQIIEDTLKDTEVVGTAEPPAQRAWPVPVQKLMQALGDQTLSVSELMEKLQLSHRPTFRKNYLNPALAMGLIERTIPDKPNSRSQKYRKNILVGQSD